MQLNEMQIFKKIFLKYKIMIIRAKISFMAFEQGRTINELFMVSIIKSYNKFRKQNLLEVDSNFNDQCYRIAARIENNSIAVIKALMA